MSVQQLGTEQLERLRRLDAATLANAIESLNVRLRNEGFTDQSVKALLPRLPAMVGYAATVRIRGSAPATAVGAYPDRTDWWEYVRSLPSPRIVVVEDAATKVGFGSLLGAVHMNILRALGCVGAVTNGVVRDLPAAEAIGFPVFASGLTVSHAYVHIVEFGAPVTVGGLKVRSGELLHADMHGVQSVPLEIADRVPEIGEKILAHKHGIIDFCRSQNFSVEQLRDLVVQPIR